MPEYLSPGVSFEFRDIALPLIRGIRTDITGFIGLAERGPINEPIRIESWRQFQSQFGDFVPYSYLAYAVKGFFENGGRTCFIVRIAGNNAVSAKKMLKNKSGQGVIEISAQNEGTWGNQIAITLTQVNSSTLGFSLVVTRDGCDRERFPDLSIKPSDKRHFIKVINEGDERTLPSQWIKVKDLIPKEMPRTDAFLPDAEKSDLVRNGFLSDGQDGIASLTKQDFLGDPDARTNEKKGLSALERVDAVGIVCIPDIHIQPVAELPKAPQAEKPPKDPCIPSKPPTIIAPQINSVELEKTPVFTEADILEIQRAMIEHCEMQKDRVSILDAPLKLGGRSFTLAEIKEWRNKFDSERGFGALYYPWVKVVDPLPTARVPVRAIPPCGHIAGLYARSDFTVGVHKAPANEELFWAEDVTVEVNDKDQDTLNPEGINCLRAFPGRGIRVYGARTVSSNPDWRYVNIRRLMLMIEEAVDEATQWAVFEPHDFNLRQLITLSISSFLESRWGNGALVGGTKDEAFYVKCDESNNPPEVVDQGKLVAEVGVAPTYPAEFIIFRIGRTVEELEIVER